MLEIIKANIVNIEQLIIVLLLVFLLGLFIGFKLAISSIRKTIPFVDRSTK